MSGFAFRDLLHSLHRIADEFFQRGNVNVGEALDVKARHAGAMLA